MKLSTHHRIGTFIFWFAQILGGVTTLGLIIFIGGTVVSELIEKLITVKEDYTVFLLLLGEILVAVAFKISWRRKRPGAILVILLSSLLCIWWGMEDSKFVYIHLPILFSGLLLLFYSYYKEWILKQKP
jgi:hypothetical protein